MVSTSASLTIIILSMIHICLILGEYARAFRQKPVEPMVSLLMGLCFLQLACQKFQFGRNGSIVQVRDALTLVTSCYYAY